MPHTNHVLAETNRVLVKLRPSNALRAAESRVNLQPLFDTPQAAQAVLGLGAEPQWFMAELPDGAANPWDLAHARVARQLGISESDVVFAEPDIIHNIFEDATEDETRQAFAVGHKCAGKGKPQENKGGKKVGPHDEGWHLGEKFTELAKARDSVRFSDRRTRIAHFDTGYYRTHQVAPQHVAHHLEKDFTTGESGENSAESPGQRFLPDNYDHGTGTIGILAGGILPGSNGVCLGGAPEAEILPLRIARRVVLLRTSAFAQALEYAIKNECDVVTMSMGGLPSRVWSEEVNKAYDAGVCIVAAAGNNISRVPTSNIVYPARYGRVIAVCGVMANHEPYHKLGFRTLEGNYGPASKMKSAIAAYTPNIPWPVFGCESIVRLNGEGTSAATPQVAAAVALWFEKYKTVLPRNWRRVEAVRHALFSRARKESKFAKELGHGILQAFQALKVEPVFGLEKTPAEKDSFAFFRVITGLGVVEAPPREQMFNLELMQRWLVNPRLQKIVPDPEATGGIKEKDLKEYMGALIDDEGASRSLRTHVAARYSVVAGPSAPRTRRRKAVIPQPAIQNPPYRRLRVYAVDPSLSGRLETAAMNEVTLKVRWESLGRKPAGEYVAIEDVDAAGARHGHVNLDDPRLLAQDGWAPSEGNPQFHQQMVYAVTMKTIEHFERALGRPVQWRQRNPHDASAFNKQLALRPHALHQANAYYSPQEIALLFGYFEATAATEGEHVPGSRVYTCLSHDIIAHETTHAILDGMYRRFNEATNPDVLAFHEAFADIVALMQHFTIPEILENEIRRTRGNIETESRLGSLAVQFGHALGGRGALRDGIGRMENGVWKRFEPDPMELQRRLTPHSRGAILVAAVFDAFIGIYNARTADLLRLYTRGTGVLPDGAIHPDLVHRLAGEAAKAAGHVLTMCIRALDYLPPVDVTFFEYLRALITADFDLVRNDRYNYRVAFVEAFRGRGIYPVDLASATADTSRTLSVDTLRWRGLDCSRFSKKLRTQIDAVTEGLKDYANACFYIGDRKKLLEVTCEHRDKLLGQLKHAFQAVPEFAAELRLDPAEKFEVHELRRAMRVGPDGRHIPQVVVALTQSKPVKENKREGTPGYIFRGGSTLVVDLSVPEIKYAIFKNIESGERRDRTAAFVREVASDPLRALFFASGRGEPFAALHSLADGCH